MEIRIAHSDEEIAACFPVIKELRPHLDQSSFVARVRFQEQTGYRLVFVETSGISVAAAGFRIGENLAWGRFLYVDDLVTLPSERSHGYGKALLDWLEKYAAREGCGQLHLDSGIQRKDAHRFYEREGLRISSYHFNKVITAA